MSSRSQPLAGMFSWFFVFDSTIVGGLSGAVEVSRVEVWEGGHEDKLSRSVKGGRQFCI